jgi:hypothetical protein
MLFSDIPASAPAGSDEAETHGARIACGGHVLRHRFAHQCRDRPTVPAGEGLELALHFGFDEEGSTFHMSYVSIHRVLAVRGSLVSLRFRHRGNV